MGIGTFGSFTQARLAIYAAQTGITVTGNNISNINTPGYTRQRLDQVSLYTAGADRYYAEGDIRTGQGALVKSLSQIRSPYLDIRYRTESAKVGYYDAKLDTMNSIAQVLDEVGKGDASKDEDGFGILGMDIGKLASALGDLTSETGHQEYDNTVKAIASSIITKLHSYAGQLESLQEQTLHKFKLNVEKVNRLLTSIRSYNEEIRKSEIHGDPALELRDKRNVDIDELSRLIDINVTYSEEEIAAGLKVEKLSITLDNANPDKTVETDEALLVDGVFAAQIKLEQIPVENPDAAFDPKNKDTWPYMKEENGNLVPTSDPKKAKKNFVLNTGEDKDTLPYLNEKGEPVADEADAAYTLEVNSKYKPYLDDEGQPTAELAEAKMVDHPNYNLIVTELKNKKGDLYVGGKAYASKSILGTAPVKDQEGKDSTVAGLFANAHQDRLSITEEGVPSEGDTTVTVYTRKQVVGKDGKPEFEADGKTPRYAYTRQVFEQILTKPVALDDNDITGELQADREMLTEKGDFVSLDTISDIDEHSAGKRGIQYYQRCLDLLANQLASFMNEANQGFRVDKDGNYIMETVNNAGEKVGVPITLDGVNADGTPAVGKEGMTLNKNDTWETMDPFLFQAIKKEVGYPMDETVNKELGNQIIDAYLKGQKYDADTETFVAGGPARGIFDGAVLFSNDGDTNDTTNITASNISISRAWRDNPVLVRSFTCPEQSTEPASGQSDNLLHMQYLVGTHKWQFHPNDLESTQDAGSGIMFEGTIHEFWNSAIGGILGEDQEDTGDMLTMYYENALSIDTDRDSVSSVDFNDEAMNLMMYSKSYNAACRLMTTIDSVLDKLINNTGMTT